MTNFNKSENETSSAFNLAKSLSDKLPERQIVEKVVDLSDKFSVCRIYLAGDWHFGPVGSFIEEVKNFVDGVQKDPVGKLILLGDLFNLSKDGQERDTLNTDQIIDILVDILAPVAKQGKLVFVLSGNHDRRMLNANSVDLIKQICGRLEGMGLSSLSFEDDIKTEEQINSSADKTSVPYYGALTVKLRKPFKSKKEACPVKFLFHHGDGIHNIDNLKKLYTIKPGFYPDFIACGHTHNPALKTERVSFIDQNGKTCFKKCHMIITPAPARQNYGFEKNYANNFLSAGIVVEVGLAPNPLASFSGQPDTIVTYREIADVYDLNSKIKMDCLKISQKIASNFKKNQEQKLKKDIVQSIDKLLAYKTKNTIELCTLLANLKQKGNVAVKNTKKDTNVSNDTPVIEEKTNI